MANLSVQIGANTSKFVQELNNAKATLEQYVAETQSATNTANENMSVTEEQANAYRKVLTELQKVGEGSMSLSQQQKALKTQIQSLKEQWEQLGNDARSSDFGRAMSDTLHLAQDELKNLKTNIQSVDGVKTTSLKKDLRMTTNELISLTAQYRAMSDAEKASASGQALAQKMSELRKKAGDLTDVIGDVNAGVKVMASDTRGLDMLNQAIGIGADAMSTYSSVIAKVTGDEKSLKSAISTVLAVQSAANLMTKVSNALQSDSAIMLGIRRMQENAAATAIGIRAAAEGKGTAATQAATAAQKAFNVVAKANPYVLLATAVLAAGAAIYAYTKYVDGAKKKDEELTNAIKSQSSELAGNIVKVKSLQMEWNKLKSTAEKKKWIDDNKEAFHALGVEVNSVEDAENLLVRNTNTFIKVLELRAKAAAYAAYAQSQYQKAIEGKESIDDVDLEWYEKAFTQLKQFGQGKYVQTFEQIRRSAQAEAYNAAIDAEQKAEEAIKESQKLQAEADKLQSQANIQSKSKSTTSSTTKTNKVTVKAEFEQGSLAAMEKQLEDLKKSYKNGWIPNMSKTEFLAKVKELEKKIKNKRIEMGLDPVIEEGSLQDIENQINEKQHLLKLTSDPESIKKIQKEIDDLTGQKKAIELRTKITVDSKTVLDLKNGYLNALDEIHERSLYLQWPPEPIKGNSQTRAAALTIIRDIDAIAERLEIEKKALEETSKAMEDVYEKQRHHIALTDEEKDLQEQHMSHVAAIKDLRDGYATLAQAAYEYNRQASIKERTYSAMKDGISLVGDMTSGIKSLSDAWEDMGHKWNTMSGFEQTATAIMNTVETLETLISTYEKVIDMVKLFAEIQELAASKKVAADAAQMASGEALVSQETANSVARITANDAEAASSVANLGIKQADALAGATKSGASLPFPANLAAIAAGIAAVTAAFALVFSKFAEGGIVGGGSYIGDKQLVRVNSGEMILSGRQQARLFNLLNGVGSRNGTIVGEGGVVKFKLKGKNLYGSLNNLTKQRTRI